jgi:hypothetical protein
MDHKRHCLSWGSSKQYSSTPTPYFTMSSEDGTVISVTKRDGRLELQLSCSEGLVLEFRNNKVISQKHVNKSVMNDINILTRHEKSIELNRLNMTDVRTLIFYLKKELTSLH